MTQRRLCVPVLGSDVCAILAVFVMAMNAKVGTFLWDSATIAGGTIVVTGVGFQPKAVIVFGSGRSDATDAIGRADAQHSFGFAVSTTGRRTMGIWSDDANTTTDAIRGQHNGALALEVGTGSVITGLLDLQAFDVDGFTLVVDDQSVTSRRLSYLALGGDMTNAAVGDFIPSSGTGNQAVTGVGFQPSCLVFMSLFRQPMPGVGGNAGLGLGCAVSSTQGWVLAVMSDSNVATSNTHHYAQDAECLAMLLADGSFNVRFTFVSMDTDGFTVSKVIAPTATNRYVSFLALKGGNYAAGSLLTRTDTNDIAVTGLGFAPSAVLFGSCASAENTLGTSTAHSQSSIGITTSVTERVTHTHLDEDNQAVSDVTTAIEYDAVYANIDAASAIQGLMDLKSMDADGFTTVMDDTDPSANWVGWLAFGPAAAAASLVVPLQAVPSLRPSIFAPGGERVMGRRRAWS